MSSVNYQTHLNKMQEMVESFETREAGKYYRELSEEMQDKLKKTKRGSSLLKTISCVSF